MKTSPDPLGGSTLRPGPASEVCQGLYSPPLVTRSHTSYPPLPATLPWARARPLPTGQRDARLQLLQPPAPRLRPSLRTSSGAQRAQSSALSFSLPTTWPPDPEGLPPEPLTSPGPKRVLSPALSPLDLAPPIGPGSDGASRPCPAPSGPLPASTPFSVAIPSGQGGPPHRTPWLRAKTHCSSPRPSTSRYSHTHTVGSRRHTQIPLASKAGETYSHGSQHKALSPTQGAGCPIWISEVTSPPGHLTPNSGNAQTNRTGDRLSPGPRRAHLVCPGSVSTSF